MASGNQKEIYSHIRYIVPDPFGGQSYELTRIFYPLPIAGSRTGQEAELSDKRIIITGDAGSGKTTLAKRLFIYFLNLKENGTSDQALREKYKLPEGLNPVFLSLRSVEDYDTCFDELIASETKDCASSVLIADGLDEVADAQLKKFIKAFERLLESVPKLSLIITSRPTAVNKSILKELIWKNGFTELSLEPFSLAQIIEYGSKRLELVCDAEGLEGLKKSFLDIVSGSKRTLSPDILKKPLELEILLSHILTDTDVTFAERTELIEQMLNGLLAGREAAVDREAFFKDQMTFLSILAFETMKRDTLYIDDEALRQAQLTALRFSFNMSSVISSWSQKPFEMLKNLSANTGIFEEDKQGQGELRFAFAIRTYQEYLCAWACCRLRMSAEADAPDPFYFIRERTGDSMWTGALSFILSFMEQGNHKDFDSAVKYAFEHIDTEAGVKNIIDSGISINYERARVLCRRFFRMSTTWDSELLTACLASQYSDVWMEALRDLYLEEAALLKQREIV